MGVVAVEADRTCPDTPALASSVAGISGKACTTN
jgi:hypothetical protein